MGIFSNLTCGVGHIEKSVKRKSDKRTDHTRYAPDTLTPLVVETAHEKNPEIVTCNTEALQNSQGKDSRFGVGRSDADV